MAGSNIFTTMGAVGHSLENRQTNDYYATHPIAILELIKLEKLNKNIWECCVGEGHLAKPLIEAGFNVKCTDLIDRGFGAGNVDFLKENEKFNGDIITNPPYSEALAFCKHALNLVDNGNKVCMFLKTTFVEGKTRKQFFLDNPPKVIYVSSSRINCAKNGEFEKYPSSAVSYSWFVWEKGYKGETVVRWFN